MNSIKRNGSTASYDKQKKQSSEFQGFHPGPGKVEISKSLVEQWMENYRRAQDWQ